MDLLRRTRNRRGALPRQPTHVATTFQASDVGFDGLDLFCRCVAGSEISEALSAADELCLQDAALVATRAHDAIVGIRSDNPRSMKHRHSARTHG